MGWHWQTGGHPWTNSSIIFLEVTNSEKNKVVPRMHSKCTWPHCNCIWWFHINIVCRIKCCTHVLVPVDRVGPWLQTSPWWKAATHGRMFESKFTLLGCKIQPAQNRWTLKNILWTCCMFFLHRMAVHVHVSNWSTCYMCLVEPIPQSPTKDCGLNQNITPVFITFTNAAEPTHWINCWYTWFELTCEHQDPL